MKIHRRWTAGFIACTLMMSALLLGGCSSPGQVSDTPEVKTCTNQDCKWHGTKHAAVVCGPKPAAPAPPPPPAPKPAPVMTPPPVPQGVVCGRIIWPTGNIGTSSILVEKCAPAVVQVGLPFKFDIKVSNLTNTTLKNVIVTDDIPSSFTVRNIEPAPTSAGATKVWKLGDLEPRGSRTIVIHGVATKPGKLENCLAVTHQLDTCVALEVIAPKLVLTKTAPNSVLKCDPIPIKFTVSNSGVGAAQDVKIVDNLPNGMVTESGQTQVTIPVGTLAAGKSMSYTVNAKAARAGTYTNKATASAAGDLTANASSTTKVLEPRLKITKTGPSMRFLGRPIEYTIVVTNTGNGEARNTMVEDMVPAGTRWVSASDGGQLQGNKIVWNVGNLAPNASKRVQVKLSGTTIGKVSNTATANAYCADAVSDTAETMVKGIPAILLECIDIEDPVEVGGICTYVIKVTNQGSLAGTNIKINATLEDTMAYQTSSGPTEATVQGKTISFAPLPSLAPKQSASWTVKVKAVKSGDVRFSINMNSDQIDRPVIETESTHFYE